MNELSTEYATQNSNRQKEVVTRVNPASAIWRQSTGGNDTMHVGMVHQILPPRMQNDQKANLRAQVLGIGRDFQQRLRRRLQKQAIDLFRVLKRQWTKCGRKRKDEMEIRHW